jgi:hypothetical protein
VEPVKHLACRADVVAHSFLRMKQLFGFLGATVGSGVGWWLGAHVGFMTAFLLSVVGTGVGIYAAYRIAIRYAV